MKTTARALRPDSHPEAPHQTGEDEEATAGSAQPQAEVEGERKCPPSILRRSWPERRPHGAEPPRTSRHVRFREPPEVAVHYIARREPTAIVKAPGQPTPQRDSLLLRLSLCVLLGVALGLYFGRVEPITLALEDLQARLLVLVLRLWRMALTGWHCLLRL